MNLRYMVVMAGVVCLSFAATPAQAAADMPARMMMHSMQDMMMAKQAKVGQPAPEFILDGVIGTESGKEFTTISLSDYSGKWLVLFFYPLDFTLVCPTEIKGFNEALPQFKKLGAEVLGVSVDSKFSHLAWIKRGDLGKLNYPLLSDIRREAAKQYGVLDEAEGIAQRGLFVIDPEGILQYQVVHNMDVGRSVEETCGCWKPCSQAPSAPLAGSLDKRQSENESERLQISEFPPLQKVLWPQCIIVEVFHDVVMLLLLIGYLLQQGNNRRTTFLFSHILIKPHTVRLDLHGVLEGIMLFPHAFRQGLFSMNPFENVPGVFQNRRVGHGHSATFPHGDNGVIVFLLVGSKHGENTLQAPVRGFCRHFFVESLAVHFHLHGKLIKVHSSSPLQESLQ